MSRRYIVMALAAAAVLVFVWIRSRRIERARDEQARRDRSTSDEAVAMFEDVAAKILDDRRKSAGLLVERRYAGPVVMKNPCGNIVGRMISTRAAQCWPYLGSDHSSALVAPPLLHPMSALFLDLDGILAPIEQTPAQLRPVVRRSSLIARLSDYLAGGLAVLSGRTLEDVDRILEGSCPAVAGVHGLVRRTTSGEIINFLPARGLDHARSILLLLARAQKDLLVEDKRHSLAVHFRLAPAASEAIHEVCDRLARSHDLIVQHGDRVCELRTVGPTKGDALAAFLNEPPFLNRRPVMVGDDLTDEDAFTAAAAANGFGVLVGPVRATAARYHLADVDAVLAWLEASLATAPG